MKKLYLVISAFIFGFTPILAKTVYAGGTNGINLTFLRAAIALGPLGIYLVIKRKKMPRGLKNWGRIILLSVLGNAASMICLYVAYDKISVGLATVLHYIYPLAIVLACAAIYKEPVSGTKLTAAILVSAGIILFIDIDKRGEFSGIILAALSGIFYAFYVVYMSKSGLDKLDYLVLTFFVSVFTALAVLIFGGLSDSLDFDMSKKAWVYSIIISVLVTFIGLPLFQAGLRHEGASTAGIISTVEPITGVVLSALVFGEHLNFFGTIGCIIIITGVVMLEKEKGK